MIGTIAATVRATLLMMVAVVALAACQSGSEPLASNTDAPTATPVVAPTATSAPTPTPTPTTVPSPTPVPERERPASGCRYLGADRFGDIQIELDTTLSLQQQDDVAIDWSVVDDDGTVVLWGTRYVDSALPDEPIRVVVDTMTNLGESDLPSRSVECRIEVVDPLGVTAERTTSAATDTCSFVELDQFGDLQVELAFTTPSALTQNLLVVFALRGSDGDRFADGSVTINNVLGKSDVLQMVSTETRLPEWVDQDDVTCEVMTIETLDEGVPRPTPTPNRNAQPRAVPGTTCAILDTSGETTPIELEFTAPNRAVTNLRLDYGLFDDTGALVWTEHYFVLGVKPGELFRYRPPPLTRAGGAAASCKVTDITEVGTVEAAEAAEETNVAVPADVCSAVSTDSSEYLQVQFAFDNRFSAGEEITVSATLRYDDGARLGDVMDYRFLASAGEVLEPTTNTDAFKPDDVDIDDLVCEVTSMDRSGSGRDFVPVEAGTPESSAGTCRYVGVNALDEIRVELEFTSQLDQPADAEVSFAVFDGGPSSLMSGSTYVVQARPGDEFRLWVDTVPRSISAASEESQISCKLIDVVPLDFESTMLELRTESTCEVIGIENHGGFVVSQLRFEITVPLPADSIAIVPFALVGPDGVRFHDDDWFVERTSTERAIIAAETVFELPDWVSAVDVTCEILGVEGTDF